MVLRRDEPYARIVVPDHKELRPGTLHRIISDAGITVDQFLRLLRR
jgi:predicted RNA binding protein YcfA (HicA-like mRNA interferase family)